jgi:glycosyltransferase involved in cell wall biosynthesis
MKILYAHSFYRVPGGEDRHVRDQVDLMSRNHTVELLGESNVDLDESPKTAVRMMHSRAKTEAVGTLIDRFRPDVVHLHNMYPSLGPAVILAAHQRRIPLIMTVHNFRLRCPNGFMFTEGAPCRRCERGIYVHALTHACFGSKRQATAYATILWAHRFVMDLERRIAMFVVPSDFMRRRMLEWGVNKARIRMVRHFIDLTHARLAGPALGTYGAFLGRLSPEKGLPTLLRALGRAGDPPFLVVGDGPQRESLELLARRLGLSNTRFLGQLTHADATALLFGARYVAITSISEETASLSALEGLAAARPLLVSDRGALPELVASGAGLLCRPGDEDELSQRIIQLMNDDNLCRRASIEAGRFAREFLSRERHVADLEAAYKEIV